MKVEESSSLLANVIGERGLLSGFLELPKDRMHWAFTLLLIVTAYCLSFWIRLEWIDFAQGSYLNKEGKEVLVHPDMVRSGVALPNTHDSFFFGSIVQKAHLGMHQDNDLVPDVLEYGAITYLPYVLLKIFPSLTIEELLLWIPVWVAGIVCIPIVLIGRLYGSSLWGFFAACLAGITHSYYNRTLAGYYDTDIFSITIPAFALYFLLGASRRESLHFALGAAISLYLYRFFYSSGQAITGSLAIAYILYRMLLFLFDTISVHKGSIKKSLSSDSSVFSFKSFFLIGFAVHAEDWSHGLSIDKSPGKFFLGLAIIFVIWAVVQALVLGKQSQDLNHPSGSQNKQKSKNSFFGISLAIPIYLLPALGIIVLSSLALSSGLRSKIFSKLDRYISAGEGVAMNSSMKDQGYSLNYLDVLSTVREASKIPQAVVRNRILADVPTCSCPRCLPAKDKESTFLLPSAFLGLLGLAILTLRYWEFCIGWPFAVIAYFCFQGAVGLRFTVHVGNIASLGITFFILVLVWMFFRQIFPSKNSTAQLPRVARWTSWIVASILVCFFAAPNLQHAKNYHSHVVYPVKTIEVLEKLNEASEPDDFVVTWWDYGSGCWFYGNTRTFTSPANQTFDNYLTSEILRSTNPVRAVNLARLKTETYVGLQRERETGKATFGTAVEAIFKDGKQDLVFYQGLLDDINDPDFKLPPTSRDIFLFLPYEILRIFPTILSFSSRNLYFPQEIDSNAQNEPPMTILRNGRREGASIGFDGGFRLDRRGDLRVGGEQGGVLPYNQILKTGGSGERPQIIQELEFDGLRIPASTRPEASSRLLFVEEKKELVIMSAATFRSTFARRFLLDRFDQKAYEHPLFEKGANPVSQPFMVQADWVTGNSSKISLHLRGGYTIEADIGKRLATVPGRTDPIPFSYYPRLHDPDTGSINKGPAVLTPNSKYHLVQTNLPVFIGGSTYEQLNDQKTLEEIASMHRVPPEIISAREGKEISHVLVPGSKIEIPAKGYEMRQSWFFMDQKAFDSLLVQGFLMENLPDALFEKVYSTAWGKVYKLKN